MNISGVTNPVIDDIVEKLISAKNRKELINYTKVLENFAPLGEVPMDVVGPVD